MFQIGVIKGALTAHFIEQATSVTGTNLVQAFSPKQTEVALYHADSKSIVSLTHKKVQLRLEIPQKASDDVCVSYIDEKLGMGTVLTREGSENYGLGKWVEDENGVGFCTQDGTDLQDNHSDPKQVLKQREAAFALLNMLQWTFD